MHGTVMERRRDGPEHRGRSFKMAHRDILVEAHVSQSDSAKSVRVRTMPQCTCEACNVCHARLWRSEAAKHALRGPGRRRSSRKPPSPTRAMHCHTQQERNVRSVS